MPAPQVALAYPRGTHECRMSVSSPRRRTALSLRRVSPASVRPVLTELRLHGEGKAAPAHVPLSFGSVSTGRMSTGVQFAGPVAVPRRADRSCLRSQTAQCPYATSEYSGQERHAFYLGTQ